MQNNQIINNHQQQQQPQQQNGAYQLTNQTSIITAAQILPAHNQAIRTNNFTNQINMQPLIKPVQPLLRNQPIQPVAPIVYSFAQPDYANKLLNVNLNNQKMKKVQWNQQHDNHDYEEDDLSNLLG